MFVHEQDTNIISWCKWQPILKTLEKRYEAFIAESF